MYRGKPQKSVGNVSNKRKGCLYNILTAGPSGPGGPSTNIPYGVRHPQLEAPGPTATPLFPPPVHPPQFCDQCDLQALAPQALPSLPLSPGVRGQPEGDIHVTPSGAREQPGHQDCPIPTPPFIAGPLAHDLQTLGPGPFRPESLPPFEIPNPSIPLMGDPTLSPKAPSDPRNS